MGSRKRFLLRLDESLWEEIERWAAQDFRSVNGQIEFLLREAVRQRRKAMKKDHDTHVSRSFDEKNKS